MITAQEVQQRRQQQQPLTDEELDTHLNYGAQKLLAGGGTSFTVTIPRHSIDRAESRARAAGWVTQKHTVRSGEPDALDGLECRLPPQRR